MKQYDSTIVYVIKQLLIVHLRLDGFAQNFIDLPNNHSRANPMERQSSYKW